MDYRIFYCFPFFLSATLIFIAALFTFRRVNERGGWYLAFVCLASTAWALSEGMLYLGFDIKTNILITKLQYFGISFVPPLTLLFGLSVFGFKSKMRRITPVLLFMIAAIIVLLVWTNPWHQRFFTEYYTIQSGPFPMLGLKHGPLWWAVLLYHYFLIAVLSIILLQKVVTSSGYQRSQAGVILVAVAFVWLSNAVYVSGNSPVPNMDISPLAFIWVAGAMAWGFFRYGLLEILPVAKAEVFKGLDDILLVIDAKDRILDINPAAESTFNRRASQMIGQEASTAFSKYPQLEQVFGGLESSEICLIQDGQERVYDPRISFIRNRNGLKVGKVIALRDITRLKQVDSRLKESEQKYRTIFHSGSQGFYLMDDILLVDCNEQACQIWACTRDDIVGHSPVEFSPPMQPDGRSSEAAARAYIAAARAGTPQRFYWQHQRKDGVLIDCEITLDAFNLNGQSLLFATLTDITKRKQAESALKESEERFRVLFESAPDPFLIYNSDGVLLGCNQATEKLTGYKRQELIGNNFADLDLFCDEDLAQAIKLLEKNQRGESAGPKKIKLYRKNGEAAYAEVSTHPVTIRGEKLVLGIARDITERRAAEEGSKKLEAQLRQAQKMEAIGTFAGGIAHDFNNILSVILGFTELAIRKTAKNAPLNEDLQEVFHAGLRARDLVKQILTFSRQAEQDLQPVQVHLIVNEALKFLRSSLPSSIEFRHNIASDASVLADPTQIYQVLMNLCANAKHAMLESGGKLEVFLAEVQLDADFVSRHPGAGVGPYLQLTVSDSGEGMSGEVQEKIFDPFFTTKGKEEGTGLGLAVVHGIIKSCGGFITVTSKPGRGSTFNVFLPVIEARQEPGSEIIGPLPRGSERVLFVDDEKLLVDIGKQMLERYGYVVTPRTSSVEALELFKAQPEQFDLVITDLTMPNMNGLELASEMIRLRPEMPVILCTGFSEKLTHVSAEAAGIKVFMLKPLSLVDLVRTTREVLDGKK